MSKTSFSGRNIFYTVLLLGMVMAVLGLIPALGHGWDQMPLSSPPPEPPALFYGAVLPGSGFIPAAGMALTAWIDGNLCGQTQTEVDGGEIVYSVFVSGEGSCGTPGAAITFYVDGQLMTPTGVWDNNQPNELPLSHLIPTDTPTPTATATSTATATPSATATSTSTSTPTPTPTLVSDLWWYQYLPILSR